jgi:hypothetical protein
MPTARAIILSAAILAVAILAATWLWADRHAKANRFDLANTGAGSTVRLDRTTGDMIRCDQGRCAAIVKNGKITHEDKWAEFPDAAPTPPPGFVLDK